MDELNKLKDDICTLTNNKISEYIENNPLPEDYDISIILDAVNREKIRIYCLSEKFISKLCDIKNVEYTNIIAKINEKLKCHFEHEFFDVDRFDTTKCDDLIREQDDNLHENWICWYIYKKFLCDLDVKNSQRELDITIKSKIEFYENIEFQCTDQLLGKQAKEFYKKQVENIRAFEDK